jgi:hypothetical protein
LVLTSITILDSKLEYSRKCLGPLSTGVLLQSFQTIYKNFISVCYPPSLHVQTQSKIKDIIGEEIEKELRTGRKKVGMLYTVKLLQHIKVILQNKLTVSSSEISRQLLECMNTPVCPIAAAIKRLLTSSQRGQHTV